MNPEYYQTVPRKKQKTDLLLTDRYLNRFILDTRELSMENLNNMLSEYNYIVFKPNIGGGGKNVGFVKKSADAFNVQIGDKKLVIHTVKELHDYIYDLRTKKNFILQKGVELRKYNNAPFDIRIEVQKPYDNWIVTGMVAKFAGKDKMVTNRHSGGTGILLDKAFAGLPLCRISEIKFMLKFLGLRCSRLLNQKYDGLREVGIDVGVEGDYDLFILEINTKPQYGVFKQAGDKDMLARIVNCNEIIFNSIEYIKREL